MNNRIKDILNENHTFISFENNLEHKGYYIPYIKTIVINNNLSEQEQEMIILHELGHAYNFNKSEFWRGMQKLRMPGMILGVILSLVPALTSSKKSKNGQELSFGDKINNTLRESAPALAFLSFTPAIAEEGMATIRGNSWAKRLLDPELYKRVVKSNKYGLLTYVLAGAGLAISSWCGKVVKDKLCD